MAAVTIRNLSEEAHRALKVRAAQHNRSAEGNARHGSVAAFPPQRGACRDRDSTDQTRDRN